MNQTPNYQLNQWDKTDRIQMEDFNADNAKIEAALVQETSARAAELQAIRNLLPIVHLQTITTTSTANKVDIDLSGIDWSAYPFILVRVDGKMSSSSASFYVRVNNYSGEYDYYYTTGDGSNSYNHAGYCHLTNGTTKRIPYILLSCQSDKPDITVRTLGNENIYHGILNKSVTASKLSLVGSASSYTITSGAKIDIYGIKF